jgi:RNA polymerase sigma factor (TIGR02999 family)
VAVKPLRRVRGIIVAGERRGDVAAQPAAPHGPTARLFEDLYRDLHRLAARQLRARAGGATIGVTTLLHEAYLDLASRPDARFPDRARFMAYAARAMRGLILNYARDRRALKRGGAFHLTSLDTESGDATPAPQDLLRLGDALDDLEHTDAALAELVDLKFFCGFSFAEIAEMRAISERTVQRDWAKARLLLRRFVADA